MVMTIAQRDRATAANRRQDALERAQGVLECARDAIAAGCEVSVIEAHLLAYADTLDRKTMLAIVTVCLVRPYLPRATADARLVLVDLFTGHIAA